MIEYYTKLYFQYLNTPVKDLSGRTSGERPRARKAHVFRDFKPKLKHGYEIDLNAAVNAGLKGGPQVWVWSDQHFGHKNIIRFSNRPYPNLDLMHECMILNHNDYVAPGDISIWVGDVAFLNDNAANEIIRQLNGYKILIIGNHDIQGNGVKKLDFDELHSVKHVEVEYGMRTYDLVFTHYPCNFDAGTINIHGHEHVSHLYTDTPQHFNVNCELHGFKPINMNDVLEMIHKRKTNG